MVDRSSYKAMREQLVSISVDIEDKQKVCRALERKIAAARQALSQAADQTGEQYQAAIEDEVQMHKLEEDKLKEHSQKLLAEKSQFVEHCKRLMEEIKEMDRNIAAEARAKYRDGDAAMEIARKEFRTGYETRLQQMVSARAREVKESTGKALQPEISRLQLQHERELAEVDMAIQKEERMLQENFNNRLQADLDLEQSAAKEELQLSLKALQDRAATELDATARDHRHRLDRMREEFSAELSKHRSFLSSKAERLRKEAHQEMQQRREAHQQRLIELKQGHAKHIKRLQQEHDDELRGLKTQAEEILRRNEAAIKRSLQRDAAAEVVESSDSHSEIESSSTTGTTNKTRKHRSGASIGPRNDGSANQSSRKMRNEHSGAGGSAGDSAGGSAGGSGGKVAAGSLDLSESSASLSLDALLSASFLEEEDSHSHSYNKNTTKLNDAKQKVDFQDSVVDNETSVDADNPDNDKLEEIDAAAAAEEELEVAAARRNAEAERDKQLQLEIRTLETESLRLERQWKADAEEQRKRITAAQQKEQESRQRRTRGTAEEVADLAATKEQLLRNLEEQERILDAKTRGEAELIKQIEGYSDGIEAHSARIADKREHHRIRLRELQLESGPQLRDLREECENVEEIIADEKESFKEQSASLEKTHRGELAALDAKVKADVNTIDQRIAELRDGIESERTKVERLQKLVEQYQQPSPQRRINSSNNNYSNNHSSPVSRGSVRSVRSAGGHSKQSSYNGRVAAGKSVSSESSRSTLATKSTKASRLRQASIGSTNTTQRGTSQLSRQLPSEQPPEQQLRQKQRPQQQKPEEKNEHNGGSDDSDGSVEFKIVKNQLLLSPAASPVPTKKSLRSPAAGDHSAAAAARNSETQHSAAGASPAAARTTGSIINRLSSPTKQFSDNSTTNTTGYQAHLLESTDSSSSLPSKAATAHAILQHQLQPGSMLDDYAGTLDAVDTTDYEKHNKTTNYSSNNNNNNYSSNDHRNNSPAGSRQISKVVNGEIEEEEEEEDELLPAPPLQLRPHTPLQRGSAVGQQPGPLPIPTAAAEVHQTYSSNTRRSLAAQYFDDKNASSSSSSSSSSRQSSVRNSNNNVRDSRSGTATTAKKASHSSSIRR